MRSKCLHDKAKPPCNACRDSGLGAADCIFPVRGQPDQDRDYRHPRMRAEKNNKRDSVKVRREILDAPVVSPAPSSAPSRPPKGVDEWDLLPPLPEIIEAVNMFTAHYFQLGFIPKQKFPERLRTNHRSVSVFFLLGILSISARLTPALIERYGSAVNASETFMERASSVALNELYKEPSLEKCQAFYLLSIAQQGSGVKDRSSINMGIAVRMATLMQLHREETYVLVNPTKELVMRAESARRTLWMLHSQDNLHSGPRSPVSLAASDITTLLPSNEKDFANAREPKSRAALEGTPPAIENPRLVADEGRSLFATLIQAHHFWGAISRRAITHDKSLRPWEPASDYAKMERRLADWERGLPNDHRWSIFLLKGYKQEGQDLAYLGVTMITRLCNIVIRKSYLHEMISYDKFDPKLTAFWARMSLELFRNVKDLYEQIETQYGDRSPEEGTGAQMAAFCVYSCGFLAGYLCKYPNVCPEPNLVREGPMMVQRVLNILAESKNVWPLASRWYDHLERFCRAQKGIVVGAEGSMADSAQPIPNALHPAPTPSVIKPIQPRIVPPSPDTKNGILSQHSNTPILPLPQPNPTPTPTPTLYNIDPNLRRSAPQVQQHAQGGIISPPQQGVVGPSHVQTQHQQQQIISGRPDGLGLLIEAFDTHQTGLPDPRYDPQTAAQDYYPQTGLAVNDGYENELGYYMSDGVPATMQNWVSGSGMYGY
ncbi:hypothetical protein B0T26DRAFT_631339 [Lasiosphaeria miniovina]|uniref:Xylanolytic transcriptional activator regulatory domain-containing protein n=1 Tax=Lasiosphaeria miniovina TaxID=1954250 RepID=A0AA40EDQ3_9PEZI|nr:uncharacterized protein B0T26DRAFT_631339 [Lasiosphaeria miniovina]KAK0733686.1 hypothetical protein B0T26DRAFT_631339 [Lasiosphaeria miniovina]